MTKNVEHDFLLRNGGGFLISIPDLSSDLEDGDRVLDERSSVPVIFDYPLSRPVTFVLEADGPFTVRKFAEAVARKYAEIYAEEDATSDNAPELVPGTLNRDLTSGHYGIWGHGIGDLVLEFASRQPDGNWRLFIGS